MAKKAKDIPRIDDFFGIAKQYHLLGVQTGESFFPFLGTLANYLQSDVRSLSEFCHNTDNYSGQYQMAFSELVNYEGCTLIILENKSTLYNQKGYPTSNKEKNLSFHTLSLFDEYCYILNSQGICQFKWEHTDCDYLLLIAAPKSHDLRSLMNVLTQIPKAKTMVTDNLFNENVPNKQKSKMRIFFEDLFCTAEIKINTWKEEYDKRLLLGTTHVPSANLPDIYKLYEEFTQTFTSKYLRFAYSDPSYDFSIYDDDQDEC